MQKAQLKKSLRARAKVEKVTEVENLSTSTRALESSLNPNVDSAAEATSEEYHSGLLNGTALAT